MNIKKISLSINKKVIIISKIYIIRFLRVISISLIYINNKGSNSILRDFRDIPLKGSYKFTLKGCLTRFFYKREGKNLTIIGSKVINKGKEKKKTTKPTIGCNLEDKNIILATLSLNPKYTLIYLKTIPINISINIILPLNFSIINLRFLKSLFTYKIALFRLFLTIFKYKSNSLRLNNIILSLLLYLKIKFNLLRTFILYLVKISFLLNR
ncbi:hypothetical protein LZ32DRAFT_622127 [Colletotrichum eremochloae]|nr:hypothetical protein LZ32DRAFT_622127 [Colletotrichum eremochloae]